MIYLESFLALLVGAAALSLILLPLLRPAPAARTPDWDLPDLEETRKGQALIALKQRAAPAPAPVTGPSAPAGMTADEIARIEAELRDLES